jgi:hypothetical protein
MSSYFILNEMKDIKCFEKKILRGAYPEALKARLFALLSVRRSERRRKTNSDIFYFFKSCAGMRQLHQPEFSSGRVDAD